MDISMLLVEHPHIFLSTTIGSERARHSSFTEGMSEQAQEATQFHPPFLP